MRHGNIYQAPVSNTLKLIPSSNPGGLMVAAASEGEDAYV